MKSSRENRLTKTRVRASRAIRSVGAWRAAGEAVRHGVVHREHQAPAQRPEERQLERPAGAELQVDGVEAAAAPPQAQPQRQVAERALPARRDRARERPIVHRHAGQAAHRLEQLAVVAGARAVELDLDALRGEGLGELVVVGQDERAAVDERHPHDRPPGSAADHAPLNGRTSSGARACRPARPRADPGRRPDCRRRSASAARSSSPRRRPSPPRPARGSRPA